ncbi:MAG: hypothetical protein Q8P02_01360, partial [Candidatus Micrarchaeota archaeon]|nr:hypothetical protein [Candidatus Micrarchaeota archaeon]
MMPEHPEALHVTAARLAVQVRMKAAAHALTQGLPNREKQNATLLGAVERRFGLAGEPEQTHVQVESWMSQQHNWPMTFNESRALHEILNQMNKEDWQKVVRAAELSEQSVP